MSDDLLPCPFCGGSAGYGTDTNHTPHWAFVACSECLASTNLLIPDNGITPGESRAEARDNWNNRDRPEREAMTKEGIYGSGFDVDGGGFTSFHIGERTYTADQVRAALEAHNPEPPLDCTALTEALRSLPQPVSNFLSTAVSLLTAKHSGSWGKGTKDLADAVIRAIHRAQDDA